MYMLRFLAYGDVTCEVVHIKMHKTIKTNFQDRGKKSTPHQTITLFITGESITQMSSKVNLEPNDLRNRAGAVTELTYVILSGPKAESQKVAQEPFKCYFCAPDGSGVKDCTDEKNFQEQRCPVGVRQCRKRVIYPKNGSICK